MEKSTWYRILFSIFGIILLIIFYINFVYTYLLGLFSASSGEPFYIVDLFLNIKTLFLGLFMLSLLLSAIMSFIVAVRSNNKLIRLTLWIYLFTFVFLVIQILASYYFTTRDLKLEQESKEAIMEKFRQSRVK